MRPLRTTRATSFCASSTWFPLNAWTAKSPQSSRSYRASSVSYPFQFLRLPVPLEKSMRVLFLRCRRLSPVGPTSAATGYDRGWGRDWLRDPSSSTTGVSKIEVKPGFFGTSCKPGSKIDSARAAQRGALPSTVLFEDRYPCRGTSSDWYCTPAGDRMSSPKRAPLGSTQDKVPPGEGRLRWRRFVGGGRRRSEGVCRRTRTGARSRE